ncbi:heme peroxidase [Triangularia verruculosa]|uniref:Heme peroxidase n=1 Tax=Triangularia verruculosa TaxID=2587418 RepID=A0AAN6XJH0_9PEZI|nr:heme peroxidase [Triangularia verruculosa]
MSSHSDRPLLSPNSQANGNGYANVHSNGSVKPTVANETSKIQRELEDLNKQLAGLSTLDSPTGFHGDALIGVMIQKLGVLDDLQRISTLKNLPGIKDVVAKFMQTGTLDIKAGAQLIDSMSNDSEARAKFIESQVKAKYDRMLHPPLTYLGDAFKYRAADGKFDSALNPHLGQAGAPYAKTVPSKTHPLGALPDPNDIFDRLMARGNQTRNSTSGLSSMLIYHATIIIHDIFRTNDADKNISDTSSYLDLSPLYGFNEEMQRQVRDDTYRLGLLKPDTFAEDRLLRQPPGVCIMLVMYNRYHNYATAPLRRINENGRFSIPTKFEGSKHQAAAREFVKGHGGDSYHENTLAEYAKVYDEYVANGKNLEATPRYDNAVKALETYIYKHAPCKKKVEEFYRAYDAAWKKRDDDLFNTARLITCGLYIQTAAKTATRGLGNQVTVEFNLLYRFHCAISARDEEYAENAMRDMFFISDNKWDPKSMSLPQFVRLMHHTKEIRKKEKELPVWEREFGLREDRINNLALKNVFKRNSARKWGVGTLNDSRDLFGMKRHDTFESISKNPAAQKALCDLYEHPDKVELYPGIFCESGGDKNADPGPSDVDSALWAAIFSDAITLVRSDRFYTVDWNTNSLTSWGMREWFPADSIRFFHPFYTSKNAQLAHEQGYDKQFRMNIIPSQVAERNWFGIRNEPKYTFDTKPSEPRKPPKPIYLVDAEQIRALFRDQSDVVVHPARLDTLDLPSEMAAVLCPRRPCVEVSPSEQPVSAADSSVLTAYFTDLMRDIIRRESIAMSCSNNEKVFSLDVTRYFAVPVVTRYVADFLGFSHMVRSEANRLAKYSENDIYQHITNCQVYLSYNADEAKLLKRRQAFKKSLNFLYGLILEEGVILEASKSTITRKISSFGRWLFGGHKDHSNPMTKLGFTVAQQILGNEPDQGKAAAIFLLVGLDSAYNSVLAFTSVLSLLLGDLYNLGSELRGREKESGGRTARTTCDWLEIQKLAVSNGGEQNHKALKTLVLNAQPSSMKFPAVRVVTENVQINVGDDKGTVLDLRPGDTIICDMPRGKPSTYLAYQSSFTHQFASYHPKHVAPLGLVTMIKVLAQHKNLRRGHDTQGRVKRIKLDYSHETFSNFMAPQRVKHIQTAVEQKIARVEEQLEELPRGGCEGVSEKRRSLAKEKAKLKEVYDSDRILKPATDTYMTPEWDEMVPFPTIWKMRFDGFGTSDYGKDLRHLAPPVTFDDFPPFYEIPGGSSRTGGSFGGSRRIPIRRSGTARQDFDRNAARLGRDLPSTGGSPLLLWWSLWPIQAIERYSTSGRLATAIVVVFVAYSSY